MAAQSKPVGGSTGKITLLVVVIVIAVTALAFLYLRSGPPGGTVEPKAQQMPPGTRGHRNGTANP